MRLTEVIRHGSNVHIRLVTEACEGLSPERIVIRTEEAAALEHLLAIARQHLRPAPAPAIAEAMISADARFPLPRLHGVNEEPKS